MGIIIAQNKNKADKILRQIEGKNPVFIFVIGNTETAKIRGISAAGKNPEITDYTPPADAELLFYGKCRCIDGVPVTPEGIPTPALITMSALKLARISAFVVNGGLKVEPQAPYIELGGLPGGDIRTGRSLDENIEEVIGRAKVLGENFSEAADYLVVGESIPGGTTTALGVLLAIGVDAEGKVSSSMIENPSNLKIKSVREGMDKAQMSFGQLKLDPIRAARCLGDPVIPAFAGLVAGAAKHKPVLMAGGTQMAAIAAVTKALSPEILGNIAIATTKWIVQDKTSSLSGLVKQIAEIPIIAADLQFGHSKYYGLRVYEDGMVKEGVGAGGVSVAAMLKSNGKITSEILLKEVERNYQKLMSK